MKMKKKSAIIFILLTSFASACNYAIYPVLSRTLPNKEFVDITVALALFTQLSAFMLSLVALTIGLTKDSEPSETKYVVKKLQTMLTHIFMVIIVIFTAFSPLILTSLHLSPIFVLPIFTMLAASLFMSIISGYLNGKQKLTQLGTITAGTALLQFCAGIGASTLARDGTITLNAIAVSSIFSVLIILLTYRHDHLTNPFAVFHEKVNIYSSKENRRLFAYIVLSSVGALALNILLVLDLLIITARGVDTKIYTDMYIISRIIFFGGMLLVWPFLSNLDMRDRIKNAKSLMLLYLVFSVSTVIICISMIFWGKDILTFILGTAHNSSSLQSLAIVSIVYKFVFLVLTTFSLVFIVYRSYWAVWTPLICTLSLSLLAFFIDKSWNTTSVVIAMTLVASLCLCATSYGFWRVTYRTQ
jgi:hypothetical protein